MSLVSVFDISGSGMAAQSIRLNTTASNIANAETVSSSEGDTYRARYPVFSQVQQQVNDAQPGRGVQVRGIVESDKPLDMRYEPDHPMADEEGYVFYPGINVVEQMTDMISASRSFQTNVEMMNTAKQMMQKVLTLGQ